jgi:hypothetical protein
MQFLKSIILSNPETVSTGAQDEFTQVPLGDTRRFRRLLRVFQQMRDNPGSSIPAGSSDMAECKAFYRLLDRKELTDELILEAHQRKTTHRAAQSSEDVFLAVQDTTTLNFTSHEKLEDQGPRTNRQQGHDYRASFAQHIVGWSRNGSHVRPTWCQALCTRRRQAKEAGTRHSKSRAH